MTATARSELLFSKAMRGDLSVEAETTLPTRHGLFRCIVFRHAEDWTKEHVAMVMGDIAGDDTLLRVHSECLTSEVFGSLKCDCADQLELALESIAAHGRGALLYLRQEGRSIGLANKIRAYALQDQGADTVDANRALNLPDDARRYDAVPAMLAWLGIHSVHLMTNNPAKVEGLRALGVRVCERVPVVVEAQPFSLAYLATKRARMRHALP